MLSTLRLFRFPFRFRLRSRLRSPWLTCALLAGAACALPAAAQGIYLCVDADGKKELTDNARKGCKALDIPGGIAAPAIKRAGPAAGAGAPARATSPADFPKVDNALQRARDNDRREILNEELRAEERKLAELRREYNNGVPERAAGEKNYGKYQERITHMAEGISRAEKNLEALRREIGNIK